MCADLDMITSDAMHNVSQSGPVSCIWRRMGKSFCFLAFVLQERAELVKRLQEEQQRSAALEQVMVSRCGACSRLS